MQAILAVTAPFFALVLCGYLAGRHHVLPESAIPGLNAYVLYFALPCMLFRFGANTPLLDLLNPEVVLVYGACALLMVLFTVGTSLNKRVRLKDAAFGALVASFPNTGFMGVPLIVALFGNAAAGPVICTILVDLFMTSSLCLAVSQLGRSRSSSRSSKRRNKAAALDAHTAKASLRSEPDSRGDAGADVGADSHSAARSAAAATAWRAVRGALANPLPWSIAIGAVFSVAGFQLLGPVQAVVDMLASSATPVALFTIGAVLWRAGQHAHNKTRLQDYLPVALIKLLLHPLLVLVACLAARKLGAGLSDFQIMVLTLAAALPSASNVSLLAERYGADNGRIARIIMASTVLAFVTFTAAAWLFGAQPV